MKIMAVIAIVLWYTIVGTIMFSSLATLVPILLHR